MGVHPPGCAQQGEDHSQRADLEAANLRFLDSVAHSLRTPLTAVLGFAELLRSDPGTICESERAELISTIASQAVVMSEVLEDLLVRAQVEMGILSVASVPVDLGAQMAQVVEHTRTDTRIALQVDGSATALADPGRVRQIIRHSLLNAESRNGQNILVRLSDHEDPALLVVISDGPVEPIEDQQPIVDPFEAARHHEGQPDMPRHGLSVARQLARLMDGDLSYRLGSDHSAITLSLPTRRPATND